MVQYSKAIAELVKRAKAKSAGEAHGLVSALESVERATRGLEGVMMNRNPADTEAAHIKKVHKGGERLMSSLQSARDRGTGALNSAINALSLKLRDRTGLRPAETVAEVVQQSEVRQALLSLNPSQRSGVVDDALKSKDTLTLNALANGAAYLSGVEPDRIESVIDSYQRQVAPEVMEQFDSVLELDETLQAGIRAAERAAADARDEQAMAKILAAEAAAGEADKAFSAATAGGFS